MTDYGERVDPVALLGTLAPPAGWDERTDIDTDEHAASIYERIVTGNVVPFRSPRRRLRIVTGIVVTVTLGATAAAALWQRSPDEARYLSCWSEASSPPQLQIGLEWDGISDPVTDCASAWRGGDLGDGGPPDQLRACVTTAGNAAVIPGDDETCGILGFAPFSPLDAADQREVAPDVGALDVLEAKERIRARFNPQTCVSAEQARVGVEAILEELGFVGWATEIVGIPGTDEPCATVALDTELNEAKISFSRRAD